MCKSEGLLKLCSCENDIDRTQSHWLLFRRSARKYPTYVGEIVAPYLVPVRKDFILNSLNRTGGCFDFEYQPEHDDRLMLVLNNHLHSFIFDSDINEWYQEVFEVNDDTFVNTILGQGQAHVV